MLPSQTLAPARSSWSAWLVMGDPVTRSYDQQRSRCERASRRITSSRAMDVRRCHGPVRSIRPGSLVDHGEEQQALFEEASSQPGAKVSRGGARSALAISASTAMAIGQRDSPISAPATAVADGFGPSSCPVVIALTDTAKGRPGR